MAASVATSGFGTLLKAGDGGGTEVFAAIAEVKSISGPTMQAAITETTHMESPNNTREFIPTLIDPGELTFSGNFLPANATQTAAMADLKNRTKRNFKLVFTNSAPTTWSFAGYYTSFQPTAEIEGPLGVNLSVKLTSFPVAS